MTEGDFAQPLIPKQLPNPRRLYSTKYTIQKLFYIWKPQHLKGPLEMGICDHWNIGTENRQVKNLTIMKLQN